MIADTDWRTVGPVLLRWGNGEEEHCADLEDAVIRLRWPTVDDLVRVENFGFHDGDPVIGELIHRDPRWTRVLVVDELGMPVPAWRILGAARAVSLEKRWRERVPRWSRRRGRHVFRRGPVPGTGSINSYSNWLRHPRTLQERACAEIDAADEDLRDLGVRVRPRRNAANLPTAYDDIARDRDRSWKRARRSQWKGAGR